jgi:hypothetical protein
MKVESVFTERSDLKAEREEIRLDVEKDGHRGHYVKRLMQRFTNILISYVRTYVKTVHILFYFHND